MTENQKDDVIEIDVRRLLERLWHRLWAIILLAVIVGALTFGYTYLFITPLYQASTLIYVNNSSFSVGSTSFSISNSEISAAQSLVDTYTVILKSRTTLEEIIALDDLTYDYEELYDMIDAAAVDSTEIFEVTVTSENPLEAEYIANTIATVLPGRIEEIVDGSSIRIVDNAVTPTEKVSPSYTKNTVIGAFIGAVVAIVIIILRYIFDENIRSEEYLIQTYPTIPLLSVVPDMSSSRKSLGYGYGAYAQLDSGKDSRGTI